MHKNKLGDMYYFGFGVSGGYTKAAEWYRKATGQGHADAKNSLAKLREKGYV
jgi:TPR repeat protein